ncbi:MAG: molybdenum cofactor biosynthesis protein [Pirellula sp.]|nr:molybdenum cofactor biosynthesis protein [Pirellula sp.]
MSRYDSPAAAEHHAQAARSVGCGVVTVSDTRTAADDRSGDLIAELLAAAGHAVAARSIVPDEPSAVAALVRELAARPEIAAILLTGGTGVAPRDQTPEAVAALFTKELPGFGELFRVLSYQEIGAAAMLSRACAGMVDRTVVFLMPGSTAGVRLAMERLIVPELGHLVKLAAKS